MLLGFDLGRLPEGWNDGEQKDNDDENEEAEEERLRRMLGGMLTSLYAWNQDVGIIYENILAKMMEVTRRSQLYDQLDRDPPPTGQDEIDYDEFNDALPKQPEHHDPWTALLTQDPLVMANPDGQPIHNRGNRGQHALNSEMRSALNPGPNVENMEDMEDNKDNEDNVDVEDIEDMMDMININDNDNDDNEFLDDFNRVD